ncbi:hypothetical protein A1019T_00787 [Psychrobacter pasteurii]|uniref:Uncharacterized protein n=1 Tax=Psychrobacter pasteurii TaxID=1945520 RepID=A0A1R4EEA6_9GAMM|nr:hypothetical protein [Psychrobacter pasteurii]SJM36820.1 hypothetical protein A1019T_00787 [Psychrobacter pasteurii]
MSNQSSNPKNTADNNESIDKALESLENTTKPTTNNESVDVEVVKGDTVIYEDGDFEEFNSENELDSDTDEANSNKEASKQEESKQNEAKSKQDSDKEKDSEEKDSESDKHESAKELYSTAIANIYQWAAKLKDEFMSDKEKKSDSEQASDEEKTDSDKKEGASDKEDKHSASIANLYKWAAKLKEDFASEAANMTHDVPEKALAIMLNKLLSGAETELKAFDKKVEQSEEPMGNAEEERSKLEAKKDKYQGMIDLLQGD